MVDLRHLREAGGGARRRVKRSPSHLHFLQNLEPFNFPDAVVIEVDVLKRGKPAQLQGACRPAPQDGS